MRSRVSRHFKRLAVAIALLGTTGVLLGTSGVLVSTYGLPLGTTTACGCEDNAPQIGLQAEGGGGSKEINFKMEALNTVRNYEIANVGTAPMEIASPKLAEEGGAAEGTNFAITTAFGKTEDLCKPPEVINANDKCYLGIKLLARTKTATFEIKWGSRASAKTVETGSLKSE